MGYMMQQLRKGEVNRQVAEQRFECSQAPDVVVDVLERIVDRWRSSAEHERQGLMQTGNRVQRWAARTQSEAGANLRCLYLDQPTMGAWTVFFPCPLGSRAEYARRNGRWAVRVSALPGAAGGSTVIVQMLQWVVDSGGRLMNKDEYDEFVRQLRAALVLVVS